MRFTLLTTLATLTTLTTAHFILHWPPTAGFDDDLEATGPCGSFTPEVNSSSPSITVDRFQALIQNVHPVGEWSFRGTTNTKAPYNFTEIVPIINTTGISDFCLEYLSAPTEWAGKQGIIQVVDNSPDGILYQCAPVNWIAGSNNTIGSACANSSSSFTASWTSAEGFAGEVGGGSQSASSASASATAGSASSSSSTGAAAVATGVGSLVGLGLLAAGLAL